MSWFSENKFLAGFGAVMVAGLGTLGYLTYSAMGKYETAVGNFDATAGQLKTLQETKPALTDANLKELVAQKQELGDKIASFQKELKARVLRVEPIAKEGFQDLLKQTVARVAAKAGEAKVVPPKDFYLGFGEYQAKPPDAKAAPALARELRAIELVMNVLIEAGNLELDELVRESLPEEGGKLKPADPQPAAGRQRGAPERTDPGVVERAAVRIKFTSTDSTLQKVIAGLANHKQQLFVVRRISVQNKQAESPPRLASLETPPPQEAAPVAPDPSAAAPADGTPPEATPPAAAPTGVLSYVFGKEKIMTTIDLELLNIADPEVKAEPAGKRRTQ